MSIKNILFDSLVAKVKSNDLKVGEIKIDNTDFVTITLFPITNKGVASHPEPYSVPKFSLMEKSVEGKAKSGRVDKRPRKTDRRIWFRGKEGRKEVKKIILTLLPEDVHMGMRNPQIAEAVSNTGKSVATQFIHSVMFELQKEGKVIEVSGNTKNKFRWIKKPTSN